MEINRRGFLGAVLALGAAPAVVCSQSLMKLYVPRQIFWTLGDSYCFFWDNETGLMRPDHTIILSADDKHHVRKDPSSWSFLQAQCVRRYCEDRNKPDNLRMRRMRIEIGKLETRLRNESRRTLA